MLALAGCGFTPLYGGGKGQATSARLDEVAVQTIPDRTGQLLRQSLQVKLHAAGAPVTELYTLKVSYDIAQSAIGVLEDTATTRNRFVAHASWTLAPIGAPDKPLVTGEATAMDADNVIDQQYFAVSLETETVDRQLADEISAQIASQLAVWFRTHPDA